MVELDAKDLKILELLRHDAKMTFQQISRKTQIPVTTVHNRIKRMEASGVIKGYTVQLDHKKLGKNITAFVLITVTYLLPGGRKISQLDLARAIMALPAVEETHIVTGGTDIITKVRVKDMDELNKFVIDDLRRLDGVENTQTIIVLSTPDI